LTRVAVNLRKAGVDIKPAGRAERGAKWSRWPDWNEGASNLHNVHNVHNPRKVSAISVNISVKTSPDVHNVHPNVHRLTLVKTAFVEGMNVVNIIHPPFLKGQ
jgi:hypothetical protein